MAKTITYTGGSPARYCEPLKIMLTKNVPVTITDDEAALPEVADLDSRGVVSIEEA